MITKDIKDAILDRVKSQIDSSNYGMLGKYTMSPSSCHTLRRNEISFKDNNIFMKGILIAKIQRRYSSRKVNLMYKELTPIINYI